jgi:hypothetical protein
MRKADLGFKEIAFLIRKQNTWEVSKRENVEAARPFFGS